MEHKSLFARNRFTKFISRVVVAPFLVTALFGVAAGGLSFAPTNTLAAAVKTKVVTRLKVEAEKAKLSSKTLISKKYKGYTGTGYVVFPAKKVGATASFSFTAKTSLHRQIIFQFANGNRGKSVLSLSVNGTRRDVTFAPTGGSTKWKHISVTRYFKKGLNAVNVKRVKADADSVSIDYFLIQETIKIPNPTAAPTATPTLAPTQTPSATTVPATPPPTPDPLATPTPFFESKMPWEIFPNETPWPIDQTVQASKAYFVATDGDDANAGTKEQPWKTVNYGVSRLTAGCALYIRGGTYNIVSGIKFSASGTANARIIVSSYPGELAILDGHGYDISVPEFQYDSGIFNLNSKSYLTIQNLRIQNAHCKGIFSDRVSYLNILNNQIDNTYSCGIGLWDYQYTASTYAHLNVIGNTITRANNMDMWSNLPAVATPSEASHEAISISGLAYVEIAFNNVYNCYKEGIDIKGNSKHVVVHHNYVHDINRQGLYADAWHGQITDVLFYNNVVARCKGAGAAVSGEGAASGVDTVTFRNNLIYNNRGTGFFFSKWGANLARDKIKVYNNTFYRNGHGTPSGGNQFFWMTGGMYLYSTNLLNVEIYNNIFSEDQAFEIAYSKEYLDENPGMTIAQVFAAKGIQVHHNLFNDPNKYRTYPLDVGWTDNYSKAYAYEGVSAIVGDPQFVDVFSGDFRLKPGSPGSAIGALPSPA
ncbi:MAG: right-handed parallel beta-helix repeat-containing protein [Clostridia bacterium]